MSWSLKTFVKNVGRSGKHEFGYEPELVSVRERVAMFEAQIGTLVTEVGGLKPRVGTLETQVEGMQNWSERMHTWTQQVQTDVHEVRALQRNVEGKVKKLETQSDRAKTDAEYLRKQFGSVERRFGEVERQTAATKTQMEGFEDRARARKEHTDGEIQCMKKKLEKLQQKVNASGPTHVTNTYYITNAHFHVSDSNSSKIQAKMLKMGSASGSGMKYVLSETVSGDYNAQDCVVHR